MQEKFNIEDQIRFLLLGKNKVAYSYFEKFDAKNVYKRTENSIIIGDEEANGELLDEDLDNHPQEEDLEIDSMEQRFETEVQYLDGYINSGDPAHVLNEYNNLKRFLYDNSILIPRCPYYIDKGEQKDLAENERCTDILSMIHLISELINRTQLKQNVFKEEDILKQNIDKKHMMKKQ